MKFNAKKILIVSFGMFILFGTIYSGLGQEFTYGNKYTPEGRDFGGLTLGLILGVLITAYGFFEQ